MLNLLNFLETSVLHQGEDEDSASSTAAAEAVETVANVGSAEHRPVRSEGGGAGEAKAYEFDAEKKEEDEGSGVKDAMLLVRSRVQAIAEGHEPFSFLVMFQRLHPGEKQWKRLSMRPAHDASIVSTALALLSAVAMGSSRPRSNEMVI